MKCVWCVCGVVCVHRGLGEWMCVVILLVIV